MRLRPQAHEPRIDCCPPEPRQPPPNIAGIFEYNGTDRKIRKGKNNLVFESAEARLPTTLFDEPDGYRPEPCCDVVSLSVIYELPSAITFDRILGCHALNAENRH